MTVDNINHLFPNQRIEGAFSYIKNPSKSKLQEFATKKFTEIKLQNTNWRDLIKKDCDGNIRKIAELSHKQIYDSLNRLERIRLALGGAVNWFLSGLGIKKMDKKGPLVDQLEGAFREVYFAELPEEQRLIKLEENYLMYHPRDLRFSHSKPVSKKLKNEFIRAQRHRLSQKSNPHFVQNAFGRPYYEGIETESIRINDLEVGIAHAQGVRKEMEDTHVATTCNSIIGDKQLSFELFAIIDGHGGKTTARYISRYLKEEIEKAISKHGDSDKGIRNALKEACIQLDARVFQKCIEFRSQSGAVAVICLKIGSSVWTANVGDSRAVLKMGDEIIQLSEDAKPSDSRFSRGVFKRGGVIRADKNGTLRVGGRLAVPRAFGDFHLKRYPDQHNSVLCGLSARPKVVKVDLGQNAEAEILEGIKVDLGQNAEAEIVLACDGCWDVASSKDVSQVIKSEDTPEENAKRIVNGALKSGSRDNCSAMVVRINKRT